MVFWFFFFKQKTAYEMRISDWSSDVCSSDLDERSRLPRSAAALRRQFGDPVALSQRHRLRRYRGRFQPGERGDRGAGARDRQPALRSGAGTECGDRAGELRSEEHTSELQSLMRISYAVFCLKKKKNKKALK